MGREFGTHTHEECGPPVAKATALSAAVSTLFAAGSVQAAQEVALVADNDIRLGSVFLILLPALGWVLFNILEPAQNQLDRMQGGKPKVAAPKPKPKKVVKKKVIKRAVVAGLGLAASGLLATQSADAATLMGQVAESDNRLGGLLLLLLPAVGWVLFNILEPAQNQYDAMVKGKK
ncbi:unnamed protein product [Ostreobium quekettii]|uniref:Photosystem II PsbY n=1 Tax=Ostreobium quekettii TaxID=121088 RepID=A0A8S1IVS5_9CHLO|nr:unnamed protein product [Ostreobium quekettii]